MKLPESFIIRTKDWIGNEWEAFEQALNEESPVSIRLNPQKANPNLLYSTLSFSEQIPWTVYGYFLNSRPLFTLDPLFHAGCYYVQDASSMFLEYFVKSYFPQPAKVLDLCAAPGGKSTHLSTVLPAESLLVANEVIRHRAAILSENLIKWGNSNTIVIQNDPKEIGKSLPDFFDVIVADLPCSGEGMFRKDPKAIEEWSVNNVRLCADRQRRIVADIWQSLKPEGILIYSTCTYNKEENEENIEWICRTLGAELIETPRRFLPHQTKGEGFFIAAIRKIEIQRAKSEGQKAKGVRNAILHSSPFTLCLSSSYNFSFISDNTRWIAIPTLHYAAYLQIKNKLKIISAGVILGEMKGYDRIPAHVLAMSNVLSEKAFPKWDVDKETALAYLRKDILQNIPIEFPKGYILITYKNRPLGFVKNIGARANNLYPQEWRIKRK